MALPYWWNDTKTKQSILHNQIFETVVVFWVIKMVYFSTVHSIVLYGIIFWGISTHSEIIFKIQKGLIGIITNSGNKDSCRDLFKSYIFSLFSLNTYFLYSCLLLRIKTCSKPTRMFIVLIQDLIMIYIFLQQIWQYFRKECGILVSKSITIFHQPLNNYHTIFLNLKQP